MEDMSKKILWKLLFITLTIILILVYYWCVNQNPEELIVGFN